MKDLEDMPGWEYDDSLLNSEKKSVDAHFNENRARELGLSEEEIQKAKELVRKNFSYTVCLPKKE